MIKTKTIVVSIITFLAVYTLLLLPQTHADKTYSRLFCKVGNYLFKDFPQGGYVNLKSQTDKGKNDIALFISKSEWLEGGKIKGVTTDKASDLIGFLITVFYLSLTIATPVSWKRRIVALTAGFVLLTAFVMLKLYIIILYSYTLVPWFGLYQGTAEKESIQFWYSHFTGPATYGYTFALLLWLALSFGKKEWKSLNTIISGTIQQRRKREIHSSANEASNLQDIVNSGTPVDLPAGNDVNTRL